MINSIVGYNNIISSNFIIFPFQLFQTDSSSFSMFRFLLKIKHNFPNEFIFKFLHFRMKFQYHPLVNMQTFFLANLEIICSMIIINIA